jgi:uncharacterized protein with GYD domain
MMGSNLAEEEGAMPRYLIQGGYTQEAWAGLVQKPEDRTAAVRSAIEAAGGKLDFLYYTFGEDDWVLIAELPDNATAASFGAFIASTGRYRNYRTTPLLTAEEMTKALAAAGKVTLRPAGS